MTTTTTEPKENRMTAEPEPEPKPEHPFGPLPTFGETVLAQFEKADRASESYARRAAKRQKAKAESESNDK